MMENIGITICLLGLVLALWNISGDLRKLEKTISSLKEERKAS